MGGRWQLAVELIEIANRRDLNERWPRAKKDKAKLFVPSYLFELNGDSSPPRIVESLIG